MNEQMSIYERPRWTILLEKKEADAFDEDTFKVLARQNNLFTEDYTVLEIESLTINDDSTAEDVLITTGALAVHEEFTNAVISTPDSIDIIADNIYSWKGAGNVFIGDMLSDIEKLNFLMKYLYNKYKELITLDLLNIRLKKDGKMEPMSTNVMKLFSEDVYSVIFKDHEVVLWWATIIEDQGLYVAIIDEELDGLDEIDKLLPETKDDYYRDYYDDYDDYWGEGWGRMYDTYDYDDKYYLKNIKE